LVPQTAAELPGLDLYSRGKVREMYDLGDRLLMVASDRISAYDIVLPTAIPDKGKVLTGLSVFWFDRTADIVPNHFLSADVPDEVRGRALVVTKREFGRRADGEIALADEVLTPDSSRFWPRDSYAPGGPQPSFDKQYVRDWLDKSGWDHSPPGPELPVEVVQNTRAKYVEAYQRITDESFDG